MNLYPFQRQILSDTSDFNRVAYYLDMGLGKTFVGAEKMIQLGNRVDLIICQKSKVKDWKEHFLKNYGIEIYDLTKKKDFESYMNHLQGIAVINYELAWRRKELLKLKNFTLMLDESSLIQNRKAKQTEFILSLEPDNVILLSGTPTSGRYENLWSQLNLLGWQIKESTYNSQYVNWKSQRIGWGTNAKIVPVIDKKEPYKNVERLKKKMRDHGAIFLKTEDVLELPEKVITEIEVESSKEYRKFQRDSIVQISGTELVGDTELTKRLFSRQLCGQYSKEKLEAFRDLLQSTNERIICFYNFKDEAKALIHIATELKKPWSVVNGREKRLANYENYDDSITFVQYQAGAMGLNLQLANIVVFYSLPDGREDLFDQAMKRIHRIGQERTCFYYILICRDSVEEEILKTLNIRKGFTDDLFEESN